MDEMMKSFMSLGVTGVLAGVLFKKFLDDSNNDKEYFRNELKESRELYKEELKKDREIYINSIEKITNRIDTLEDKVEDINKKLEK